MERETIIEKVATAFTHVLEHDNFTLTDATTADDVEGWESITHMMIISEIETMFGIKFKLMDLMHMNNIGDLIKSIQAKV